jgi:hypothetical protein
MDLHRLAQERTLQAHRVLAERIEHDSSILVHARNTLSRWIEQERIHPEYATKWASLLDGPLDRLRSAMTAESETSRDLRQTSPFAGCLSPRERWQVWKASKVAA